MTQFIVIVKTADGLERCFGPFPSSMVASSAMQNIIELFKDVPHKLEGYTMMLEQPIMALVGWRI